MSKTGFIKSKFVSINPVLIDDWMFKVSTYDGQIMVITHNKLFEWTNIRFFESENSARNYIEYLQMQSQELRNNK